MIDRRTFIGGVAASILLRPLIGDAQPKGKVPAVGFVNTGGSESLTLFREALRELGYIEGKSIILERRSAGGNPEAFAGLVAELVRLNVDVLYVTGPAGVRAASNATNVIPIVALDLETDPVQSGLVRSLARPGGNITGLFLDLPDLAGKWLELLREVVPQSQRVGVLWDSTTGPWQLKAAEAAARRFDVELQTLEYRSGDGLHEALKGAVSGRSTSIVTLSSPIVSTNSKLVADFTLHHRLPAISPFRNFPSAGGLISYGPNVNDFYRRAAMYVDRILQGAKPADLPIQQPTKFELVINLKTAKALNLTIPPSVLARADDAIR